MRAVRGGAWDNDREVAARRWGYWRSNLRYVLVLLSIWCLVSFGFGIVLVKPLNHFSVGGAPLGFWFAQQGSIYVFVLLILVYVVLMNRLDRRWGFRED
jgi:putative solute:sodium symporter small subunit